MTLDAWLERLRMMSRCSIVELSPGEVGDLVNAIGPRGDAAAAEREACAEIADELVMEMGQRGVACDPQRAELALAARRIRARGNGA